MLNTLITELFYQMFRFEEDLCVYETLVSPTDYVYCKPLSTD